jgi:hypothetical protein
MHLLENHGSEVVLPGFSGPMLQQQMYSVYAGLAEAYGIPTFSWCLLFLVFLIIFLP